MLHFSFTYFSNLIMKTSELLNLQSGRLKVESASCVSVYISAALPAVPFISVLTLNNRMGVTNTLQLVIYSESNVALFSTRH